MNSTIKKFDAVKESRKWKLLAGKELQGLTIDQQLKRIRSGAKKFYEDYDNEKSVKVIQRD